LFLDAGIYEMSGRVGTGLGKSQSRGRAIRHLSLNRASSFGDSIM